MYEKTLNRRLRRILKIHSKLIKWFPIPQNFFEPKIDTYI